MGAIDDLLERLTNVIHGDESEATAMGFDSTFVGQPSMPSLSWLNLQAEHFRCCQIIAAARQLGMGTLEKVAEKSIDFIGVMANKFHNRTLVPIEVSGADAAEMAQELILELRSTILPPESPAKRVEKDKDKEKHEEKKDEQVEVVMLVDEVENVAKTGEKDKDKEKQEEKKDEQVEVVMLVDEVENVAKTGEKEKDKEKQEKKDEQVEDDDEDEDDDDDDNDEEENSDDEENSDEEDATGEEENLVKVGASSERDSKKGQSRKKKRIHYTKRKCPLCKGTFVHLRRHLENAHVKKNERIPSARVESLIQMAIHGNKMVGGKVTKEKKGVIKVYRRNKEICPLCDTVTTYLTTHLQRMHKLAKGDHKYQSTLTIARRYRGQSAEVMWDKQLIARKKGKVASQVVVSRKRKVYYTDSESGTDSEAGAERKKKKSGLQLLAEEQELSSTTSDESYFDETTKMIPGTPIKLRSVMSTRVLERKDEDQPVAQEHPPTDQDEENSDEEREYSHSKKVYNRVRYLQGRDDMTEKLKTITYENATERSSLWVKANSVTSNVSKRFSWAKTDEEIMKIAFREYESCPSKANH
ncbi:hypothetical protein OS493_012353 [Desmophyllum pertusum]|uniref:Uncharacterized protein n=1 Tax=Desmophyllum pertusum TaxID=174260 RepID=A0A9W9ZRA5_9CNID|nr:hypothetical protein OS493_012353 [Desmophyllum pertusum]